MFGKIKAIFGGERPEDKKAAPRPGAQEQPSRPEESGARIVAAGNAADVDARSLLEGELNAARKIQMGLVPKTFPPIPGCLPFDLYAILEPAREIGGDFYDFWLNGRERLTMVVGDVSGKGIPAALFMAVCRTYLRAFSRSVSEPAKLLEFLNNELSRHNESCMFVTLICATVHIPTGKVEYANAGHNPPFLRRRDGSVSVLQMAENMPIGFMKGLEFATETLDLETGDMLFLYTDGMPEAFNAEKQMLGENEALALFKSASATGSCRAAIGQLRAEIDEFADGAEQSDDITMLMYGQIDQRAKMSLTSDIDISDIFEGDSAVFSLSNLKDALPRPAADGPKRDLGLSLSGLSGQEE